MALMDINLTGATFTDYHLVNVGVGAFQLEHDWFTKEDLVIRTAPAWGGTLLIEGTDYTLGTKSNELSARVSAAGPTRQVFHKITIINASYQTGDLYFSGKYIADSNEAGDINDLQDQLGAHAALTGSSAHGAVSAPTASQLMTRDAAGRAQVVAPSVAADIARKDTVDELAGVGRTTETVKANADAIATLDSAAVKKTGNQTIEDIKTFIGATVHYAPVGDEPSLGTLHLVIPVQIVTNYDPPSTPTTYAVPTITAVPIGTKAVLVDAFCQSPTVGHYFQLRKTGATWGIGQDLQVTNQNLHLIGPVALDSSRSFDFWFVNAAIVGAYAYLIGYWI